MKIKQDPVTGLWCREDGAVLLPPCRKFPRFRWTSGCINGHGYCQIRYLGKIHAVHQLICRAFHGLPPEGKPCVDHKSRIKSENFASNLHWVSPKENSDNQASVDNAIEEYGVRECADKRGYDAARIAKMRAQGLTFRKGPDGKFGWYPYIRS